MTFRTRVRGTALIVLGGLIGSALLAMGSVGAASGSTAGSAASTARAAVITTLQNCGPGVYYRPDGTRMRCTFADYFGGSALKTGKWSVITSHTADWGVRPDCYVNSKYNIAVNNGVLKLVTRRGLAPFRCGPAKRAYTATATSATVSTYQRYSQRHGRIEIRAKFPYSKQRGLQSALWLWPTKAAGAMLGLSGEIDIAEWYSQWYDRVIPYLHHPLSFLSPSTSTNNFCMVANVGNWHTYVLEWSREQIVIKYDGRVCLRNTSPPAVFNTDYFLSLTQGLGVGKNQPTALTPMRPMTQIDYVRIWS